MKINEMFQTFVNSSYDDLLGVGRHALNDALPYCKIVDKEYEGVILLSTILIAAVNADGEISDFEFKFISELLGVTEATVRSLAESINPQLADELVNNFADSLDADGKSVICTLILTVLACDKRVNVEENKYLRKILD